MARFTATTESEAAISAARSEVWNVLTDPEALPQLTPFLDKITPDGDLWRWEMGRIPVLGVSVAPAFTERMRFDPEEQIDFEHDPPQGKPERAAATGQYKLTDIDGGTHLAVRLDICVDLPLPKASAPAVNRIMSKVMKRMGDRFSVNLLNRLNASLID